MASYNKDRFKEVPLTAHLGFELIDIGDGTSTVQLVVDQKHLRSKGVVHGGTIAALLDCAVGMAAVSIAPDDHDTVTVQLNSNFLRTVREGQTLTARGSVRHAGRRTAVAEAAITDEADRTVAIGTATMMFVNLR